MTEIPVIKIVWDNPQGWALINESDFNPSVHQRWTEPSTEKSEAIASEGRPEVPVDSESEESAEILTPTRTPRKRRNPIDSAVE